MSDREGAARQASKAAYYRAHRAEILIRTKANKATPQYRAYKASPEYKQHKRDWERANYPTKGRGSLRERVYGLSPEAYAKMVADQGGVCAICKRDPSVNRGGVLAVDHNHRTGKVRALLCQRCNLHVGYAEAAQPTKGLHHPLRELYRAYVKDHEETDVETTKGEEGSARK